MTSLIPQGFMIVGINLITNHKTSIQLSLIS